MPRSLEQVNHTVSIKKEPESEKFEKRLIFEFKLMQQDEIQRFWEAIEQYQELKDRQKQFKKKMIVKDIRTEEHKQQETNIQLRIVEQTGLDVNRLVSEDYKELKQTVNEDKRQKFLEDLERTFDSDNEEGSQLENSNEKETEKGGMRRNESGLSGIKTN
jgi:hypothetical protein